MTLITQTKACCITNSSLPTIRNKGSHFNVSKEANVELSMQMKLQMTSNQHIMMFSFIYIYIRADKQETRFTVNNKANINEVIELWKIK